MTSWPKQRIAPPDPEQYSPQQRQIHDEIASGPRGGLRGPLAVWLNRPELASKAQALGRYCRYDTTLPPKLSELAILVTAKIFKSEYEWQIHKKHAEEAGLSPSIIEAIGTDNEPDFNDPAEAVVYKFTHAAHLNRSVDDQLFERTREAIGEDAIIDLVGLLGYYTLISLSLNIFQIPPLGDNPTSELPDE